MSWNLLIKLKFKKKNTLCECNYGPVINFIEYNQKHYIKIGKVKLNGVTLTCKHPDNIIQLKNDEIFVIDSILNIQKNYVTQENINNLYIYGTVEKKRKEVFDFPTASADVGLIEIITWEEQKVLFKMTSVKRKCILLNMNDSKFVITLLHV